MRVYAKLSYNDVKVKNILHQNSLLFKLSKFYITLMHKIEKKPGKISHKIRKYLHILFLATLMQIFSGYIIEIQIRIL